MKRLIADAWRRWHIAIAHFTGDPDLAGCCGCGRPIVDYILLDAEDQPVESYCSPCFNRSGRLPERYHIQLPTLRRATWPQHDQAVADAVAFADRLWRSH